MKLVLQCAADGNPPVTYTWIKVTFIPADTADDDDDESSAAAGIGVQSPQPSHTHRKAGGNSHRIPIPTERGNPPCPTPCVFSLDAY